MLQFPNCKINIGLYISGRRDDGFHDLESVFYPVSFNDALEIIPSEKFSFKCEGIELPGNEEDNLCVKAYRLLQAEFDLPAVDMFLLKNIPTGAGLGGGSADGAFTLRLLNDIFKLNIGIKQLESYAAILGSDCPFFIRNTPCFVKGRGEILEEIEPVLAGYHITIVHPGIHISTKKAFQNIRPQITNFSLYQAVKEPLDTWQGVISNAFEEYAFGKYPILAEIKNSLKEAGATYTSMSGSGSAIYGISKNKIKLGETFGDFRTWQGLL
jgi:4-diphosphocytidyl-2-C-methyl-D-erythritol kinase